MRLTLDKPAGEPSFALENDEVDTVIDLICKGAREARKQVTAGLLEVPITIMVGKAGRRRIKRKLAACRT